MLDLEKAKGAKWQELPDKEADVYIPLLKAFMEEIRRSALKDPALPHKMVEYLLGKFDFYKVISIDSKKAAQIQAFNLYGTLNESAAGTPPLIIVPVSLLPTKIISLDFKPNSDNTLELYMDRGWRFGFRIHNAITAVETSLKFDVQIVEMPSTIATINCAWE